MMIKRKSIIGLLVLAIVLIGAVAVIVHLMDQKSFFDSATESLNHSSPEKPSGDSSNTGEGGSTLNPGDNTGENTEPEEPDTEKPNPEDPDPEDPDPEDPNPEDPNPEDPDPEDPDPEEPDPEDPDPEDPDPDQPDPEEPDPEEPDPDLPPIVIPEYGEWYVDENGEYVSCSGQNVEEYKYCIIFPCGAVLYFNEKLFEITKYGSYFGDPDSDECLVGCPDGCCVVSLKDTMFNPSSRWKAYSGEWDADQYVGIYTPIEVGDTKLYSVFYQCRNGCETIVVADLPFSGSCPECMTSFYEDDFLDYLANGNCLGYQYVEPRHRWQPANNIVSVSANYAFYYRCICGTFYFANTPMSLDCKECGTLVDVSGYSDSPKFNNSNIPTEIRYYYWEDGRYILCAKEDAYYYEHRTTHDCGAIMYWYGDDVSAECPYCGEFVTHDPDGENPDYPSDE